MQLPQLSLGERQLQGEAAVPILVLESVSPMDCTQCQPFFMFYKKEISPQPCFFFFFHFKNPLIKFLAQQVSLAVP